MTAPKDMSRTELVHKVQVGRNKAIMFAFSAIVIITASVVIWWVHHK